MPIDPLIARGSAPLDVTNTLAAIAEMRDRRAYQNAMLAEQQRRFTYQQQQDALEQQQAQAEDQAWSDGLAAFQGAKDDAERMQHLSTLSRIDPQAAAVIGRQWIDQRKQAEAPASLQIQQTPGPYGGTILSDGSRFQFVEPPRAPRGVSGGGGGGGGGGGARGDGGRPLPSTGATRTADSVEKNKPTTAGPLKTTESEKTAAGFLRRMQAVEDTIAASDIANYVPTMGASFLGQQMINGNTFLSALANGRLSEADQRYFQAASDWIRAKLRKESGAAIGKDEFTNEYRQYFPIPGDSPAVVQQKSKARLTAQQALADQAGAAWKGPAANATAPVRVRSVDEARKLAPGTVFITPDGQRKVR